MVGLEFVAERETRAPFPRARRVTEAVVAAAATGACSSTRDGLGQRRRRRSHPARAAVRGDDGELEQIVDAVPGRSRPPRRRPGERARGRRPDRNTRACARVHDGARADGATWAGRSGAGWARPQGVAEHDPADPDERTCQQQLAERGEARDRPAEILDRAEAGDNRSGHREWPPAEPSSRPPGGEAQQGEPDGDRVRPSPRMRPLPAAAAAPTAATTAPT